MSRRDSAAVYTCDVCSFSLWSPIHRLSVYTLGLYDDARFPGRCLLVLHRHAEHFTDLAPDEVAAFAQDLQRAGRAILAAAKPVRMNYALLGNKAAHVHYHLIPRPALDPVPDATPWHHPEPVKPLAPEERLQLIQAIAAKLA